MTDLFRDTVVGKALRLASRGKLYPFVEEQDPSLWQRYVHQGKTQEMASHGRLLEDHEKKDVSGGSVGLEKENCVPGPTPASHETSRMRFSKGDGRRLEPSRKENAMGHHIDPEKGRDVNIVEWYGPDDPEVYYGRSRLLTISPKVGVLQPSVANDLYRIP